MLYVYSVAYRDRRLVVSTTHQLVVSPRVVCADSLPNQCLGSRVLAMFVSRDITCHGSETVVKHKWIVLSSVHFEH